jgi:(4S)-4-hydroxy-5-phosphonooxypentane-2,3-dione isomerase
MEGMIMESERFDGLVRSFGQTRSRRQTVRGLAGVAAGVSALALSGGTRAQDASPAASPAAAASPVSPLGTEIAWVPVWTVTPGASLEGVRAVLEEMVTSAQSEAGTLSYAVYVSEDGQTIIFYERYADEAAVLAHQAHFGERFAERAQEAGMTCTRITVFGSPGEEVRNTISGCHPIYLQPFGGFSVR